jgi:hypothetical protein
VSSNCGNAMHKHDARAYAQASAKDDAAAHATNERTDALTKIQSTNDESGSDASPAGGPKESIPSEVIGPLRFAYADPPYLGCCKLYDHFHGDDGRCWDDLDTHRLLIERLCRDYPDGWAMSGTSGSLRALLPLCPPAARVGAWVKPFASFKPNVNPGYTWEPVIFHGGRGKRSREELTVRDYVAAPITLKRGLTGAKPEAVCRWILDFLGYRDGDTLDDIFPGTAVMGRVLDAAVLDFGASA